MILKMASYSHFKEEEIIISFEVSMVGSTYQACCCASQSIVIPDI